MNLAEAFGLGIDAQRLSIPSTWDFSMNPHRKRLRRQVCPNLSIPSTWDFSMNHTLSPNLPFCLLTPFNSLYLGFLHESLHKRSQNPGDPAWTFNSLYLGFLHESKRCLFCSKPIRKPSFNSLYLGFLHESLLNLRPVGRLS